MLITLSEAAKIAGISKAAVRKAALEAQKINAIRDDHGRWRVDVADVQRLWPRTPAIGNQRTPVIEGDHAGDQPGEQVVIVELRVRLEAAERLLADRDATLMDLRRRLDAEAEERRRLTAMLTDQRSFARARASWWRRLWSGTP